MRKLPKSFYKLTQYTVILLATGFPNLQAFAKNGEMSLSCFAYRDINRNGIYDMADRPYGGLKVQLEGEGKTAVAYSNIAGFANFKSSASKKNVDVTSAGTYTINAIAPGGFLITSNNARQTLNVKTLAGSPSGLITQQTLVPVGVAPQLKISGSFLSADLQDLQIFLRNRTGTELKTKPADDGSFSLKVTSGDWTIEAVKGKSQVYKRHIKVSSYPVLLGSINLENKSITSPSALTTINFDELTTSDTLYEIPNGYGGVGWTNWVATHNKFYKGAGYVNATHSGEFAAYTSSGHPGSIHSKRNFDFTRALVSVAWSKAEQFDVIVKTWRGKRLIKEDRFRASRYGPIDFQPEYQDITRIEFSSAGYWQVVLDDLHLRVN